MTEQDILHSNTVLRSAFDCLLSIRKCNDTFPSLEIVERHTEVGMVFQRTGYDCVGFETLSHKKPHLDGWTSNIRMMQEVSCEEDRCNNKYLSDIISVLNARQPSKLFIPEGFIFTDDCWFKEEYFLFKDMMEL